MPLAVIRTNVAQSGIPKDILEKMYNFILKTMECDPKVTMAELLTDVPMIRAGSRGPMVVMEIHHSDDKVTEDNKREIARQLADALMVTLKVSLDRILVLFFDTRCTTMQSTRL